MQLSRSRKNYRKRHNVSHDTVDIDTCRGDKMIPWPASVLLCSSDRLVESGWGQAIVPAVEQAAWLAV